MKKISKKKLKIIFGQIVIIIVFISCLIDFQFWSWYSKNLNEKTEIESWTWNLDTDLQNITWTFYIWPNKQVRQDYLKYFNNTDNFLKIQNYQITQNSFKEQLQKITTRKIPVQLILESQLYSSYQNYFKQVKDYFSGNNLVSVHSDDPMWTTYVHTKMMVNEDGFRIQTANRTKSSFESNREHFYHSTNPEIRENLVQLFDSDWQGSGFKASQLHPNLVVCPINCRAVIETLLRSAQKSITIQTQYVLDPQILAILHQKSTQLDLKIIVADTDDNSDLIKYFWKNVARKLKTNYNHTKMILIDDKTLLLGSMNLSANSLDNNREIWILLLDTSIIQQFKEWFSKDWTAS